MAFAEVVIICEAEYNQETLNFVVIKNRSTVFIGICQANEASEDNVGRVNNLGEVESVKCVTQ